MSERLEKIKEINGVVNHKNPAWREEIDWLINRAEKLEKEKDFFRSNLVKAKANEVVLRSDNKRYKQALEFYADEENHVDPFLYTREDSIPVHDESKVNEDGGKIARQALTGDEP